MTSRALSIRKSSAWQLFYATVKKNLGITALITVFMLLICPGYTLIAIKDYFEYNRQVYDFNETFLTLNIVITVLTCGIAVVCSFINFAFMYSKKSGDVYFSLPLTRTGLLLSRLSASVTTVLPSLILCYGSMGFILLLNNVTGDITRIIAGLLINLLLVIMCCCVTMIFIVCAGNISDLLISFAGVNIGILAFAFIFFLFCEEFLSGFYSPSAEDYICAVSPYIYGFVKLANFAEQGFAASVGLWVYIIRTVITAIISLIVSVLLFKKRKSEKCTCAYAYRGMYYVCSLLIGFVAAYLVGLVFDGGSFGLFFVIFGLVGALLGTVTFGLITDRGFKTIKSSLVVGGCSFGVMIALMIVLAFGGFGYTDRLPAVKNIETASVSFDDMDVTFNNPELVLSLHKKAIESEKTGYDIEELADSATPDENYKESKDTLIQFEYKLKNGTTVYRRFWVKTKTCAEELMSVFCSKENIEQLNAKVDSFVGEINIHGYYGEYEESYVNTQITRAEAKRLVEAYILDMPTIAEDVVYCDGGVMLHINGDDKDYRYVSIDMRITKDAENCHNTVAALQLIERTKQEEEKY